MTEVDPSRIQRGQRAELLRDLQRRVIRQHDAAGADTDRRCRPSHVPDQHRSRRTGDAGHVVVLSEPVPSVAQALRKTRELDHVRKGAARVTAFDDRHQIQDREWNHRAHATSLPRRV
jgi:hypothetical protein